MNHEGQASMFDVLDEGCPYPLWCSWIERPKGGGGCSGSYLDDYEAAVLIGAGCDWHLYDYDYVASIGGPRPSGAGA